MLMYRMLIISLAVGLSTCGHAGQDSTAAADLELPTPTEAQLAWQESELGVLFSYDIHTFTDGDYWPSKGDAPITDPDIFNPTELDTDQWVGTAKAMGAKFAIFTVSHVSGFRLWQSDANPFSLKATKWGGGKRDILAEFIASCRKHDIKPGVFMGIRQNAYLQVFGFKPGSGSEISQQEYNRLVEKEVEEICTRYGDLFELWFDGGAYGREEGGPDVLGIFEKHQPNGLFYHSHERADLRWGGSESGTVGYPCWATMPFDGYMKHRKIAYANGFRLLKHGDPDGRFWCPAMSDAPLRAHEWFWEEGDEKKVRPLSSLLNMYYKSIGRNSTLVIGLAPDRRGLLQDADVDRCREFGRAIKKLFSNKIAETSGRGYAFDLDLDRNSTIDHVVIQEDIRNGERVRKFKVEYFSDGKWFELGAGSCIGHKRIIEFDPIATGKIRLGIGAAVAEPIIRTFAAYDSSLSSS